MTGEERLRQLMRDPGWSVPGWPDAPARIRRAARRQRLATAGAGAALTAVVATAALISAALLSTAPAPLANDRDRMTATARPSGSPSPSLSQVIPPVGSPGFPDRIYPAAVKSSMATGVLALCPAPAGLEAPGPATPAAAARVLLRLGRDFANDLRVSDRSAWPLIASSWRPGGTRLFARSAGASVRYSGPLRTSPGIPAAVMRAVVTGCGPRVAIATWVIVYGPAGRPALDAEILFVTRRGHMLFYTAA